MKKNITLFICLAWCAVQSASAWNRTAHEAIAYIAEQHLTPSAKTVIEKYLDGRSIVYYAAWMRTMNPCPHRNVPN